MMKDTETQIQNCHCTCFSPAVVFRWWKHFLKVLENNFGTMCLPCCLRIPLYLLWHFVVRFQGWTSWEFYLSQWSKFWKGAALCSILHLTFQKLRFQFPDPDGWGNRISLYRIFTDANSSLIIQIAWIKTVIPFFIWCLN